MMLPCRLKLSNKPCNAPFVTPVYWYPRNWGRAASLTQMEHQASWWPISGGIFGTRRSFVKGCFLGLMLEGFAFEVELLAIMEGIILLGKIIKRIFRLNQILLLLLWWFTKGRFYSFGGFGQAKWCQCLLRMGSMNIKVSHILCKGNSIVTKFAFVDMESSQSHWWYYTPNFICSIIYRDMYFLSYYQCY